MPIEDVRNVVYVSTDSFGSCKHCATTIDGRNFAEGVNHYLTAHGYKLLHIGQETTEDRNGNPWQKTVALLGRE